MIRLIKGALLVTFTLLCPICHAVGHTVPSPSEDVVVAVASSVLEVVEARASNWKQNLGANVRIITGPSSTLANQILQGLHPGIFISASPAWMQKVSHLQAAPPAVIATNQLVLVTTRGDKRPWDRHVQPSAEALKRLLLSQKPIAVGDPTHVPVGIYTQQALTHLGIWSEVKISLLPAKDARTAVQYLAGGHADFGFLYASDLTLLSGADILWTIPENHHDPIEYYATIIVDSAIARAVLADLQSIEIMSLLQKKGFTRGNQGKNRDYNPSGNHSLPAKS